MKPWGDRWSLVVLRDMTCGGRRAFRVILTRSEAQIAFNILAQRLRKLVAHGFVTPAPDPAHRQRTIYALTEKAIGLVPVMAAPGTWGSRHLAVTPALSARARVLDAGGPAVWDALMGKLRAVHWPRTSGWPTPPRAPPDSAVGGPRCRCPAGNPRERRRHDGPWPDHARPTPGFAG